MVICRGCGQFSSRDFLLSAKNYDDFTRSQWNPPWVILLLYRAIVTGYFLGYQIYLWTCCTSIKSYIYMTEWTFLVFNLYNLAALINLGLYLYLRKTSTACSVHVKIQWLLCNILLTWTWIVLVIFWAALFDPRYPDWFYNITCHLLPAVLTLLDLCIAATPLRLAHIIYPLTYGVVYLTFTLIYWATDHDPIYPILDYSGNSVVAACSVIGMCVAIFVFHALAWGTAKLRLRLARKLNFEPQLDNMETELIDRSS